MRKTLFKILVVFLCSAIPMVAGLDIFLRKSKISLYIVLEEGFLMEASIGWLKMAGSDLLCLILDLTMIFGLPKNQLIL